MLRVSIVIPVFNARDMLDTNLSALISAAEVRENGIAEVIAVDDASGDGSGDYIRKTFPSIDLLQNRRNRGFARSVNRGVERAGEDVIVLLNTDVKVEIDFLVSVHFHFHDNEVFAVSFNEQGFGWAKGKFVDGFVEHEQGGEPDKPHPTFWVNGGSGVFRRDIWLELGGFDAELYHPFYWEDVDLSYRAMKRGYKLLWEPEARVVHRHESTIGKHFSKEYMDTIQERNQLLFIWKNITDEALFKEHRRGLLRRIGESPGYIETVLRATAKLRATLQKRETEKEQAVISDTEIFSKFEKIASRV